MLDSKSTRVAAGVRELLSEGDGREAHEDRGLLASFTVQTSLKSTLVRIVFLVLLVLLDERVLELDYLSQV